jgi:hypothetical protein
MLRNGGPAWTGTLARHRPELVAAINRNTHTDEGGASMITPHNVNRPPATEWSGTERIGLGMRGQSCRKNERQGGGPIAMRQFGEVLTAPVFLSPMRLHAKFPRRDRTTEGNCK